MREKTLYRRNNHGKPCYWYAECISQNVYDIHHGIVGGANIITTVCTKRASIDEVRSKYNEKLKQGYKFLDEIKDDTICPPVEGSMLAQYLETYLPYDRTTSDGTLLPMLAKVYNDNVFNKISISNDREENIPRRIRITLISDVIHILTITLKKNGRFLF